MTIVAGGSIERLRHDLEPSGLFTIDALASVAPHLRPSGIEHHVGDLPALLPSGAAPQLPDPVDVVLRTLADNGCWVLLGGLEAVDAYRAVLDQAVIPLLDSLAAANDVPRRCELSAFVAGPRAVVPVHIDRHHNLLLQLSGHKTVWIGTYADDTVGQIEVERRYGRDRENPHRRPDAEVAYELGPGDALYIPPFAFHRIEGADDVSIAMSCAVRSERAEQRVLVHRANGSLRRFGIRPRPPGRSPTVDRAKEQLVRVQDSLTRIVRR